MEINHNKKEKKKKRDSTYLGQRMRRRVLPCTLAHVYSEYFDIHVTCVMKGEKHRHDERERETGGLLQHFLNSVLETIIGVFKKITVRQVKRRSR
jgi:nitrate reductase assembly molybdenum cofactor insertion protein NarJ